MGKRGGNRPRAGKEVDDASYAVTEEEVREFLRSEAGRDPGVVDRFKAARGRTTVDHRPRIREIFDDAVNENIHAESFNDLEIDLSPVLDEAASLEERAYHAEAGRLYRNISEVIGEYMPGFDRWEGDYRDIFGRCVDAAARCAGAGGGQDAWREWISYAVGRFLDAAKYKDGDYGGWKYRTSRLDTIYKRSLERECRKKADLEYSQGHKFLTSFKAARSCISLPAFPILGQGTAQITTSGQNIVSATILVVRAREAVGQRERRRPA